MNAYIEVEYWYRRLADALNRRHVGCRVERKARRQWVKNCIKQIRLYEEMAAA